MGFCAVLLLATAFLGGCRAPANLIESAFREVRWYRDGFRVDGSSRRFRYISRKQREEGQLILWSDYREKVTYVDLGMDGTVDEIRFDAAGGSCRRGAPGQDELFEAADDKLALHSRELEISSHVKTWRDSGPDGYARLRGVGSY